MIEKDIPKRSTVTNEVHTKALKVKALIRQKFQLIEGRISFTFDAGTSRAYDPYLTVTAHWIDNDWELRNQIIAFTEIHGEHTGANTGAILVKIFQDYNILDARKVHRSIHRVSFLLTNS
jgi:hypothetical protein